jgi:hypothetical protein
MPAEPLGPTRHQPAPPPLPIRHHPKPLLLLAALLLTAATATLFTINPTTTRLYPPCPLHATTGLFCPGCGSTRALHHLLHGRLLTAFDFNPLLVASLPFLLYAAIRFLLHARRPAPAPPKPLPAWAIWSLLVLVLAFGILRNLPWQPVRWMAP